jgi:hypothetical protein
MKPTNGISITECQNKNTVSALLAVSARLCLLWLTLGLCHNAQGQYSIDWFKVSGGGGTSTSTNNQYSVTGIIGQPEAGPAMTGGGYSLTGGFWAIYALPTLGAPTLTIQWVNPTTVKVSWPSPSGFSLQETHAINPGNWSDYVGTISDDGSTKSITVSPPSGILFFRLKK